MKRLYIVSRETDITYRAVEVHDERAWRRELNRVLAQIDTDVYRVNSSEFDEIAQVLDAQAVTALVKAAQAAIEQIVEMEPHWEPENERPTLRMLRAALAPFEEVEDD